MKQKARKWAKFIGYNVVVVLLILCCFEWYLAAKLNNPASAPAWLLPTMHQYYGKYDRNIIQMDPSCAHYDSNYFYVLNPGSFEFSNREFSTKFEVNSAGWRDDEASMDHPKVIVLGDSYAMGWGVQQQESFPQLLEHDLGFPVLNTGISSYGTARETAALSKVNTDSLEYLIIQYCPNDFIENKRFILGGNTISVSSQAHYQAASENNAKTINYYFLKHVINFPGLFFSGSEETLPAPAPNSSEATVVYQEAAFIEIIRQCEYVSPHTKIIVFTLEAEYCNAGFITGVKNRLDKNYTSSLTDQMSFVDLTGLIDSRHRYLLDPHLNAAGHQVVANQLKTHLDSLAHLKPEYRFWLYESGDTAVTCNYENGLKQGVFKTYWGRGQLSSISHFDRGSKEGLQTNYAEDGSVLSVAEYHNNQLKGWPDANSPSVADTVFSRGGVEVEH